MIYQLPTGKTIYLSLEEYLNLTHEDIQYLISTGIGSSPTDPFHGSSIKNPKLKPDANVDPFDKSLDHTPESEDIHIDHSVNLDEIPDEDFFLD